MAIKIFQHLVKRNKLFLNVFAKKQKKIPLGLNFTVFQKFEISTLLATKMDSKKTRLGKKIEIENGTNAFTKEKYKGPCNWFPQMPSKNKYFKPKNEKKKCCATHIFDPYTSFIL